VTAAGSGGTVIVNGANPVTGGTGVFPENVHVTSGVTMDLQAGAITFDTLQIDSGTSVTVTATLVNTTGTLAGSTGGIVFTLNSSQSYTETVSQFIGGSWVLVSVTVNESLHSNGNFTIDPGTPDETGLSGAPTKLINSGGADMYFDQGSLTHIGTPGTAATTANSNAFTELVDVDGHNAFVKGTSSGGPPHYTPGATFVNDGFLADSVSPYSG
jgi:hypothetical protein